ncbi:MAG TPA: polyamine aminopropyltransferase [Burkholderiales bacterium]|nr:polyamine aminopropyltransferase [Burkholderiales bacterium]
MGLLKGWRATRRGGADASVEISEQDGIRYLHLGSPTIQSGMRLSEPDELVLAYTRSMMAFLLFVAEPRRVVSVGLGGGSVNKWIYRQFPQTEQVVLELNPRVIAVARQYFHVPPDDARLQVMLADGARWVGEHPDSADVILVDGYDGKSHVKELTTAAFYTAAAGSLRGEGVLVVNLWGSDRSFDECVHRIEAAFTGRVACVPALQKGNVIVLAFKRLPARVHWDELRVRARLLQARYGLEFLRFVEGMKRVNPHTDKRLLI